MKEEQYNIEESLNAAENQYFANIKHNKDLVWERIDERMKKKKIIPFWIYYAAASILLLIGMYTIFKFKLDGKNNEIAGLKNRIELQQSNIQLTKITESVKWKIDTVKILNEKIVGIPVQLFDTLIVHDTITKTLVKNDTIYINSDNTQKPEKNLLVQDKISDNQINDTYFKDKKKKRNRRFIFQFGKQQTENQNIELQNLISLGTK
jgi:hypothetical protein